MTKKWIRAEKRLAIYLRDDFTCAYCGTHLKDSAPERLTLDHLIPRSQGGHAGNNEPSNLITACVSCNSSRQDRPWTDYATGGAQERILRLITMPINVQLAKAIIADKAYNAEVESATRQDA